MFRHAFQDIFPLLLFTTPAKPYCFEKKTVHLLWKEIYRCFSILEVIIQHITNKIMEAENWMWFHGKRIWEEFINRENALADCVPMYRVPCMKLARLRAKLRSFSWGGGLNISVVAFERFLAMQSRGHRSATWYKTADGCKTVWTKAQLSPAGRTAVRRL